MYLHSLSGGPRLEFLDQPGIQFIQVFHHKTKNSDKFVNTPLELELPSGHSLRLERLKDK